MRDNEEVIYSGKCLQCGQRVVDCECSVPMIPSARYVCKHCKGTGVTHPDGITELRCSCQPKVKNVK